MDFQYFSHNGQIEPIGQAIIPLSSIEYSYGFGVYETIRVTKACPYFIGEHITRLFHSAQVIGLEHQFDRQAITGSIQELIGQNEIDTCNLKILLIGGKNDGLADFYVLCLRPHYPERKLYQNGAHFITYQYERLYPSAKTLNMLPSYLAYRQARYASAYDALLLNRKDYITEGTRTNFFAISGKTIISAPEEQILAGVMRKVVLRLAKTYDYELVYQAISPNNLNIFDGAFVTSTSSKIMPVKSVDHYSFKNIPKSLRSLMSHLDDYLKTSNGQMDELFE